MILQADQTYSQHVYLLLQGADTMHLLLSNCSRSPYVASLNADDNVVPRYQCCIQVLHLTEALATNNRLVVYNLFRSFHKLIS